MVPLRGLVNDLRFFLGLPLTFPDLAIDRTNFENDKESNQGKMDLNEEVSRERDK